MAYIHQMTHNRHGKSLTDWKICGCQKDMFFFFQLHNFRYVKGDQSIEKESSTNVALFFNEIPHLPINTEPLLYHHHHYQLNHSTKYYYQHSFVRQFPPLLIAETWTVIINIYHHVNGLNIIIITTYNDIILVSHLRCVQGAYNKINLGNKKRKKRSSELWDINYYTPSLSTLHWFNHTVHQLHKVGRDSYYIFSHNPTSL